MFNYGLNWGERRGWEYYVFVWDADTKLDLLMFIGFVGPVGKMVRGEWEIAS